MNVRARNVTIGRHMRRPNRWRHLDIIATVSDVFGPTVNMTAGERQIADMYSAHLPRHVQTFSRWYGILDHTVHVTATPINEATPIGGPGFYWVTPADAANVHAEAQSSTYDSVCLYVSNTGIPGTFSGLTIAGPYPEGHSYIAVSDDPVLHNARNTLAVHELSWHLCKFWIDHGFPCPVGLDASAYIDPVTGLPYDQVGDDYHSFYRDFLQGKMTDPNTGQVLGGTPAAWATGRPVT